MKVTLPYDQSWTALEWAKNHCPSYITNRVNFDLRDKRKDDVDYFFSQERDVVLFSLRWS